MFNMGHNKIQKDYNYVHKSEAIEQTNIGNKVTAHITEYQIWDNPVFCTWSTNTPPYFFKKVFLNLISFCIHI